MHDPRRNRQGVGRLGEAEGPHTLGQVAVPAEKGGVLEELTTRERVRESDGARGDAADERHERYGSWLCRGSRRSIRRAAAFDECVQRVLQAYHLDNVGQREQLLGVCVEPVDVGERRAKSLDGNDGGDNGGEHEDEQRGEAILGRLREPVSLQPKEVEEGEVRNQAARE